MRGNVAPIGLDGHRTFSNATARDGEGRIVWRQRLEHADRPALAGALRRWPAGTPVLLEATFGWGWMSDALADAGLDPRLVSSQKVAAWRDARGIAKSNRTDADLLSELDMDRRWWEVWLAPAEVRDQREWMRYRMTLVALCTSVKNRIHAVLHRHGIVSQESDLFGRSGRELLKLRRTARCDRAAASARSSTGTPMAARRTAAVRTSRWRTNCAAWPTRCGNKIETGVRNRPSVRAVGRRRGAATGQRNRIELVRERASPSTLWSVQSRRTREASDLFVSGPPAPDEIM